VSDFIFTSLKKTSLISHQNATCSYFLAGVINPTYFWRKSLQLSIIIKRLMFMMLPRYGKNSWIISLWLIQKHFF